MAGGGSKKKRFQFCTGPSGQEILHLRILQGHSGRNPIDPTRQDNVLIPNDFFKYIYHMRCAINLHSIVNLSNRETVFFTSVDPMNKEYKDPDVINLDAPRLAWYKQKVWKKQQTLCNGLTSNLFKRKDLSSIKHDRTQSSFTTRSQLIVSWRRSWWELEKSYTRKYMRHLDLLRKCPLQTIGGKNWVQKLLEVVITMSDVQSIYIPSSIQDW